MRWECTSLPSNNGASITVTSLFCVGEQCPPRHLYISELQIQYTKKVNIMLVFCKIRPAKKKNNAVE